MNRLVCDFCCSKDDKDKITWDYPCKTFSAEADTRIGKVTTTSHGNWAACVTCHRLIDDGKREELVTRSAEIFLINEGVEPVNAAAWIASDLFVVKSLKDAIKNLHDKFFANRIGPCKLVRVPNDT